MHNAQSNRPALSIVSYVFCFFIAWSAISARADSPAACNPILKNTPFKTIVTEHSKSAHEELYEWLMTATWETFKERQDAGLRMTFPVEGIPVQADGKYSEDQFKSFVAMRSSGKVRNFSGKEFLRVVEQSLDPNVAKIYIACLASNSDPRGAQCWLDHDDRREGGVITVFGRYFMNFTNDYEPTITDGGMHVDGGEIIQPTPFVQGSTLNYYSKTVSIRRNGSSEVVVRMQTSKGACPTVVSERIDTIIPPPVDVGIFPSTTLSPAPYPAGYSEVPDGYKLIGGGALVNWVGEGNMLIGSYPEGKKRWVALAKEHVHGSPATLTVWAIGIRDPLDLYDVETKTETVATQANIKGQVKATLPLGFTLVGGGAKSEPSGNGRLLTGTYPVDQLNSWIAEDKDHKTPQAGSLTSYAIGIRDKKGRALDLVRSSDIQLPAEHPTARKSVSTGYRIVGGGARTDCVEGILLTASYPLDENTWLAEAKDHDAPCVGPIHIWAIGLKIPPGSTVDAPVANFLASSDAGIAVPGGSDLQPRRWIPGSSVVMNKIYISRENDTPLSLALRFFGEPIVSRIFFANPNLIEVWRIPVGTTINIR